MTTNGIDPSLPLNFAPHIYKDVPRNVALQLQAITQTVADEFICHLPRGECFDSPTSLHINNVEGVHFDGYFALQRGGFECSAMYRCDEDSSFHLTDGMSEAVLAWRRQADEDFMQQYDGEIHEAMQGGLPENWTTEDLSPELLDAYYSYIDDLIYNDPALVTFRAFVDQHEDTITMELVVNYKDAPYYRSKYDDVIWSRSGITYDQLAAIAENTESTLISSMREALL